ncbi:MAG: 50S ribosomal protein L3 [Coxiella sp. RIFCSPHIGHO2_12_FULL_42_15]|nr:MAG: 50S ribosomal protein L3 [Coxiella sp. RIFCSPHIGHO2_12_FULL_42_15]
MSLGLVGKKCGMTRIFTEEGFSIPVTVIEVVPNRVSQVKTVENDGYCAVQVVAGQKRASHVNKPTAGHFAKAGIEAGNVIKEFRMKNDGSDLGETTLGDQLTVTVFETGQRVDVRGVTKGKGFAGVIKRHHFTSQNVSHGNSLTTRAHGSCGQNQSPGRVIKGKRMAGHMGDVNRTIYSQEVVRVDAERNLLLIKGAVPGAPGGMVVITRSVKKRGGK